MATTKDYLDQLTADKALLVQILNSKGVTASDSETFTELVPKVDTISGGGGAIGDKDLMGNIDVRISATVEEVA